VELELSQSKTASEAALERAATESKRLGKELADVSSQFQSLKSEMQSLKDKAKKESPLKKTMRVISEQNPELPVSRQLGMALKKNAARVIDLFRQWDTDGDGEVSRKEFHKAIPALGIDDMSKDDIDSLFDEWDADGGGSLDFKELSSILKGVSRTPSAQREGNKMAAAGSAMKAMNAFKK